MINFGMEYELEGTSSIYATEGWRAEHDGTLRNSGVEFVFNGKADYSTSLSRVRDLLTRVGNNYVVSHRCSTHIHVDTQQLNGYARVAFLLGLVIHDRWFFQYSSGRESNNFCTPVYGSPNILSAINRTVRTRNYRSSGEIMQALPASRDIRILSDYDMKYMSINTMPVQDWGSIELRHFDPIMDYQQVETILSKITDLYTHASRVGNGAKTGAASIWDGYDPTLKEEIEWVQGMYSIHNQMTGQ